MHTDGQVISQLIYRDISDGLRSLRGNLNCITMDHKIFLDGILKTGFNLEYQISEILRLHDWTVISNKYYIDDLQETVREIDLLAYKVSEIQDFLVYTTLIVSCKKSESDAWVLLAKPIDITSRNVDWQPVHLWSNLPSIDYATSKRDWKTQLLKLATKKSCAELLAPPRTHIFSFQEMDLKSGAPHNDKNIFSSVTSLMKAQAYELDSLPNRKKTLAFYQFNLLSVMETDLVRLNYSPSEVSSSMIVDEPYIASYIIAKQQTFARIHFIKASAFESVISKYDKLHEVNMDYCGNVNSEFYSNAALDPNKRALLMPAFKSRAVWDIQIGLSTAEIDPPEKEDIFVGTNRDKSKLIIYVGDDPEVASYLNNDDEGSKRLAVTLAQVFHYKGPFEFESSSLPF